VLPVTTAVDVQATVLAPTDHEAPATARLLLGDGKFGVDGEQVTERVAFTDVFDLRVGAPPFAAEDEFDGTTLTVAFDRGDERRTLFAGGNDDSIEQFGRLFYRRLLNGTAVVVRHDGDDSDDDPFHEGALRVSPTAFGVTGIETPFVVDLDTVVVVSRSVRELRDRPRRIIEVRYLRRGAPVSVELSIDAPRKQHLLGRYLRLEYDATRRDLVGVDSDELERRLLAALYEARGAAATRSAVESVAPDAGVALDALAERNLVAVDGERVALTPRGWILVSRWADAADRTGNRASNSAP
jgi:hypothetical protein